VFREVVAKEREECVVFGGSSTWRKCVGGFSGVLEGAHTIVVVEGDGQHESAIKNIALFDLGVVEEDGEGPSAMLVLKEWRRSFVVGEWMYNLSS